MPQIALWELETWMLFQKFSCCDSGSFPFLFQSISSLRIALPHCNNHVQDFHEAWDYQACLVSLLRKLMGVDFQGSWK